MRLAFCLCFFSFFNVSKAEERPWWPVQSPTREERRIQCLVLSFNHLTNTENLDEGNFRV